MPPPLPATFMHAEWITLHDSLGYRRFVDFLRAESDPVGPAQPDLCRDFFRRLYPSNSLSSKPPIPTGLDTILPAAYTINQSQRTPLRSMTSNDRQRARVAQENDHAARLFHANSGRREISLRAGDCVEWVTRPTQLKRPWRDKVAESAFMRYNRGPVLAAALAAFACLEPAFAKAALRCPRFSGEEIPAPIPSQYPSALERLKLINQAVKSTRYSVLFFGDSLTEGWDAMIWARSLASRALNAGVSGDRTDHLLWRLQHGNLAGPQPKAVVLLIGTNDLAYGRSPELTADGIRANLEVLRERLPAARILLLGLLPREESPSAPLRLEVAQVNQLIRDCGDGEHIYFAEIGEVLLDRDGHLSAAIAPDQLHFTELGYTLLAARLDPELDRLLGPSR